MGRWSRALAPRFLRWLRPQPAAHWLDVGCGTGALTAAILDLCEPASVEACDPSEPFIAHARRSLSGGCTFHVIPSADALPSRDGGFDTVVSGLVLNFLSDPKRTLETMRDRARRGAIVAAYVWDYAGGIELLKCFWEEAVALSPGAASVDESRRFERWDQPCMVSLFNAAGFSQIETAVLEIQTHFSDFADYWRPFLGGSGPAPAYVASLDPTQRELLRSRLAQRLRSDHGEQIQLRARALAVRGASL
jgi:SAM-dependent methyltransferase